MTTRERVFLTLVPVGTLIIVMSSVGIFNFFTLNQLFRSSIGRTFLLMTSTFVGAVMMAVMALQLQILFLRRRRSDTFNQERWWHLYFGAAAGLSGFVTAFLLSADTLSNTAFWLLAIPVLIGNLCLASFLDSGRPYTHQRTHQYTLAFGGICALPILATLIAQAVLH